MSEGKLEVNPNNESANFAERAKPYKEMVSSLMRNLDTMERVIEPFKARLLSAYGREVEKVYLHHILTSSTPPMGYRGRVCTRFDFEGEDSVARFLEKACASKGDSPEADAAQE